MPGVLYATAGLKATEDEGEPPGKVQIREVYVPVPVIVGVKCTESPGQITCLSDVKSTAIGNGCANKRVQAKRIKKLRSKDLFMNKHLMLAIKLIE